MLIGHISAYHAQMRTARDTLVKSLQLRNSAPSRFAMGLAWQDGAADAAHFPELGNGIQRLTLITTAGETALLDANGQEIGRSTASEKLVQIEAEFISRQVGLLGALFQGSYARAGDLPQPIRQAAVCDLSSAICRFEMLVATLGVHALDRVSTYAALHRSFADLVACLSNWDLVNPKEVEGVLEIFRKTGNPWAITATPLADPERLSA